MKLSEAIRLGAMLKPKGCGWLLFENRTCALGAACEAVGTAIRERQQTVNNATFSRWPILRLLVESPIPDPRRSGRASVSTTIQSLNDTAGWTREQIADWVETIEAADESSKQPEAPAAVPESSCSPTRV